jgi:nucleotide-sensitive chloride channel 1A
VVDVVGDLFITNKRVIWLGKNGSEAFTFECDVPYITMHALCKDPESFPKPCIYCQLYTDEDAFDFDQGGEDTDEVDSKEHTTTQTDTTSVSAHLQFVDKATSCDELYLIPSKNDESESGLQSIFDALSQAALLNPDEESDSEEQDASEDIMWTAEKFSQFNIKSEDLITDIEDPRIGEKELAMLAHYDSIFKIKETPSEES